MRDGRSGGSRAGGRPAPDREALRRQVRHPYITRQEPRRKTEDEGGAAQDESLPTPDA